MTEFAIRERDGVHLVQLTSTDGVNRLTSALVAGLRAALEQLARQPRPIVFTGNHLFFSAGADLNEIAALNAPEGLAFARAGQRLTNIVDQYPALTIAAISGYCMGGAIDLALACDVRIASPTAIFGHRGAALGLITGWGGTQRLPRLIGRARALQMFCAAEKLHATDALDVGLVNAIAEDPVATAVAMANGKS